MSVAPPAGVPGRDRSSALARARAVAPLAIPSTPAKRLLLTVTVLAFALTWIAPRWPLEQALHGSLTVAGLAWLWHHDRRWPLHTSHYAAICAFVVVHSVAARWLYTNLPYDAWIAALTGGWSINDTFGLTRNHADRVIHLLFGMCFAPALREFVRQRWPALSSTQAFVLAVGAVMCVGLVYEWFEWLIALLLSPEDAESYNGQQGDVWDAHADMLLATLGALVAWRRTVPAVERPS